MDIFAVFAKNYPEFWAALVKIGLVLEFKILEVVGLANLDWF